MMKHRVSQPAMLQGAEAQLLPDSTIGVWSASSFQKRRFQVIPGEWPPSHGADALNVSGRGYFFPEKVAGGPGVYFEDSYAYARADLNRPLYHGGNGLHLIVAFAFEEGAERELLAVSPKSLTHGHKLRLRGSGSLEWFWDARYGAEGNYVDASTQQLAPGSYLAHVRIGGRFDDRENALEVYDKTGKLVAQETFEGGVPGDSEDTVTLGFWRYQAQARCYIGTAVATGHLAEGEWEALLAWLSMQHAGSFGSGQGGQGSEAGLSWWWLVALAGGGAAALWAKKSKTDQAREVQS